MTASYVRIKKLGGDPQLFYGARGGTRTRNSRGVGADYESAAISSFATQALLPVVLAHDRELLCVHVIQSFYRQYCIFRSVLPAPDADQKPLLVEFAKSI
jgi:hypothetical protein